MTGYLVAVIAIVLAFAFTMVISIIVAVIKGFRAGETVVEIRLMGVIQFSIRLSDVSAKKHNNRESLPNDK